MNDGASSADTRCPCCSPWETSTCATVVSVAGQSRDSYGTGERLCRLSHVREVIICGRLISCLPRVIWQARSHSTTASPLCVVPENAVALAVLLVGYPGTERIWYQRAFADEAMSPRDVWRSIWRL